MANPQAKYEIVADDKTAAAWKSATKNAEQFGEALKGMLLPIASGAAFAGFIKNAWDSADAIGDAADRAGVAASELSRLNHVAEESDVSFESLTVGVKKFQKHLSEAAAGSAEAQKTLTDIGLSADDLRGKNLDEQLAIIADKFGGVIDPADRTRIAMDLFGKSGADLIPMLAKGSDGIRELAAEADRLGITLDDRAVKSIDRSKKALDAFWQSMKGGVSNVTGNAVADVFGTGDKAFDLQHKIDELKKQKEQLQNFGLEGGSVDTNRVKQIDSEVEALRKQLDVYDAIAEKKQLQAGLDASISSQRQTDNAALIKQLDAQAYAFSTANDAEQKALKDHAEYIAKVDAAYDELKKDFVDYYQQLNSETKTSVSKQVDEWDKLDLAVDTLQQKGIIDAEEAAKRKSEISDNFLQEQHVKGNYIVADNKKTADASAKAWETFAKRSQSYLADFLYDPFKDGLQGMLHGFADLLRRMAAEAAAASIFQNLGIGSKGKSGGFNWGSLFNLFGGAGASSDLQDAFTGGGMGARASGGSVNAGGMYLVGEKGPELFNPSSNGSIIPNNALGGGGVSLSMPVVINIKDGSPRSIQAMREETKAMQDRMQSVVLSMKKRGVI